MTLGEREVRLMTPDTLGGTLVFASILSPKQDIRYLQTMNMLLKEILDIIIRLMSSVVTMTLCGPVNRWVNYGDGTTSAGHC